ncbi:MAG TPA: hypothetical protein PKE26_13930 [Kiritimatiellia bacterium]|nr:hypothetical protein [Kiritimatiellia bacterium]
MKLLCPACDIRIPKENIHVPEGMCACPACGEVYRIADFLRDDPDEAYRIERPAYSEIETLRSGESFAIHIPPLGFRSPARFMLFFTLFWNTMAWFMWIMAIRDRELIPILFMIPFILIGLVTLGIFLFFLRGKTHVLIDDKKMSVIRSLFGFTYRRDVTRSDIAAITHDVVYAQNYQPVYGIGIKRTSGKTIKFGANLTEEERKWLIGEIRFFLHA